MPYSQFEYLFFLAMTNPNNIWIVDARKGKCRIGVEYTLNDNQEKLSDESGIRTHAPEDQISEQQLRVDI